MAAADGLRPRRVVAGLAALATLVACDVDTRCEAGLVVAALSAGTPGPGYLELSDAEAGAVGLVRLPLVGDDGEPFTNECTGVLFAPGWALSAKHCLREQEPEMASFLVGRGASEARALSVARVVPHAELDLVLFELAEDVAPEDAAPLPPLRSLDASRWEGALAQIGGFGRRLDGGAGRREFIAEPIVRVRSDDVWVDGEGRSGACKGDSGGPLLVRGADGRVSVMGILSEGSPSCTGIDRFVRVDAAGEWIDANVHNGGDVDPAACGRIAAEGRCFGEQAVWCEEGALAAMACTDPDQPCGWDADASGYRCRRPEGDPCDGVDQVGRCGSEGALRCDAGSLLLSECGACGLACARAPDTGVATCLPEAETAR